MTIDPIVLEIVRNQLASIAEEMGIVLRNTSFSPNIKERVDCSAAVFTPEGEMLAQAEHIPVHLGSMPASVRAVLDLFGSSPEPGTQYAVNDPFAGGTHLNDLTLVRPVYVETTLVAWVGNRAHHADVGGEAPGSMPAHATTVMQEGIVISPMVAARNGVWDNAFLVPFIEATRTPAERHGDLSAQIGANEAGAIRLEALVKSLTVAAFRESQRCVVGIWRAENGSSDIAARRRVIIVYRLHGIQGRPCRDRRGHDRFGFRTDSRLLAIRRPGRGKHQRGASRNGVLSCLRREGRN